MFNLSLGSLKFSTFPALLTSKSKVSFETQGELLSYQPTKTMRMFSQRGQINVLLMILASLRFVTNKFYLNEIYFLPIMPSLKSPVLLGLQDLSFCSCTICEPLKKESKLCMPRDTRHFVKIPISERRTRIKARSNWVRAR